MFGRGINRANRTIGQAHIGMRHHRLGAPSCQIIPIGHAHGGIFVRHNQGFGQVNIPRGGFGQPFNDRGKIGAGIGKNIINPHRLHPRQKRTTRRQR